MEQTWQESHFSGSSGFILQRKLLTLKLLLKTWNREVYGNVAFKLQTVESKLHNIDLAAKSSPLEKVELKLQREEKK
mgnify:CR=1 FL=1